MSLPGPNAPRERLWTTLISSCFSDAVLDGHRRQPFGSQKLTTRAAVRASEPTEKAQDETRFHGTRRVSSAAEELADTLNRSVRSKLCEDLQTEYVWRGGAAAKELLSCQLCNPNRAATESLPWSPCALLCPGDQAQANATGLAKIFCLSFESRYTVAKLLPRWWPRGRGPREHECICLMRSYIIVLLIALLR